MEATIGAESWGFDILGFKQIRDSRKERKSFRKILVSIKMFCPRFWGRKWLRQFYGHLEKCVLSAGKSMSIKFLVLGGGGILGLGGGSADSIFMGAGIFLSLGCSLAKRTVFKIRASFRECQMRCRFSKCCFSVQLER